MAFEELIKTPVRLKILLEVSSKFYDSITLFLLSISIRLFYTMKGFWIAGDSADYIDIAKNLTFHNAFAFSDANGDFILTAFRPLLYPLLISSFWSASEPPIQIILILQILMGASTVLLTYLIASKLFNRTIAVISALLLALSPLTLHYTAAILTETLFTLLVTAGCYFWGNKKPYLSGLFFGLGFLARPIIFPFLLLIFLLSFFRPLRHRFKEHFIILLIAICVSSPWIVRNTLLLNKFTLTQSSGYGTNILYGSIETSLWGDDVWSKILKDPLTQPNPDLNEVEQDRFRMKLAVSRISDDPVGWLKVRAKQYPRLFIDSGDYLLPQPTVPFGQAVKERNFLVIFLKMSFLLGSLLVFLFFWIGLYFSLRQFSSILHILLFPCFTMLIHLPMWIELRYNLPSTPFIYIIVTVGLIRLLDKFKILTLKNDFTTKNSFR